MLHLRACVKSRCISPQLARSVRRVCQWLQQPVTFSGCQHTPQPPVTSSALTWHVKTWLEAPRHPPAPAHLPAHVHQAHALLLKYRTIKSLKAVLGFLTASWTQSHASQMPALFFFSSLSAPRHIFFLPLSLTKSHATTLSGSICLDWIDGPRAFLPTKALPNMVSYRGIMLSCHSIWGGDPLCQSWSGTAVTAVTTQLASLTWRCEERWGGCH